MLHDTTPSIEQAARRPEKVSLFQMADVLDTEAQAARSVVAAWERDHPHDLMPEDDPRLCRARALEAAYLTIGLMSLEEEASRDFIRTITKSPDARLLIGMLTRAPRKPAEQEPEAEAA